MPKIRLYILSLLLVSCPFIASAFQDDALIIWINNDKSHNGLREVAERFTADTGIKIIVETQDDWPEEGYGDPAEKCTKRAATVGGADVIIWPHDRFGSWINEGFLEPITPSRKVKDSVFDAAWGAVTVGSELYGYPLAMEAISLMYNKDMVPVPPTTFEEVIALDKKFRKQNRRALTWAWNIPYFTWPLITSGGGYSFKKVNNAYQLDDTGIDSAGAIKGYSMLNRLVTEGLLKETDDWGVMMDGFKSGNIAMIINGPWTWNEVTDAGINFGLAPIPAVDKNSGFGKPFVGYLAAAINSYSQKTAIAENFIENYLMSYEGLKTLDKDRPLGATANKQLMEELKSNPHIAHTFKAAINGETMPDIPEMNRFWSMVTTYFPAIATGESDINETAALMGAKLRRLDKMKGWRRRHYLATEVKRSQSTKKTGRCRFFLELSN